MKHPFLKFMLPLILLVIIPGYLSLPWTAFTLSHDSRPAAKLHVPQNSKKTGTVHAKFDPEVYDWFVVHVTDGDTLVVKQELAYYPARKEIIRMLNINTPERGENLYKEATEALKEFVKGGDVTLEYKEQGKETRGVYGRLLAYVLVDGRNINIEMVRLGFSTYWTKYGKSRFDAQFKQAEQEAKAKKRGIWSGRYTK